MEHKFGAPAGGNENAHRMIFVSDLPRTTSYLDIADYYEKNIGPCQICIKRPLFKNFYYAFLMFEQIEHSKKAVEEFRYPCIKPGKMSRALPYNQHAVRGEPGGKDVQSTSIFIKGFEKMKWSHEDLYSKFCTFGKILSCKVSIDPEHNFLGYGYVQFSKIEEAQKAIKEMDKYDLASDGYNNEGILQVLEYQGKKGQLIRKASNNLYIKNFSKEPSFQDEDLAKMFSEFGKIQNACIMRDSEGNSKGFGFVCFEDPAAAQKANDEIGKLQLVDQEDKGQGSNKFANIYVREAKAKCQRQHELMMQNFKYKKSIMFFSLFVKNFPPGTTEDELKIYFSTACQGEVTKIGIIPGTQQAFVNFEKQDQCKQAKEFARNVLFKSQFALYVEYCYPKEMRAIRNEEIIDKRAMEKKKNQQNQAQIASLNGSQNLIDLLTMLLKPAFNQGGGNYQQRRSFSQNSNMGRGGSQMGSQGGLQQQMMQQQQQNRYQQRGGYQGGYHRNNSQQHHNNMGQPMPQPHVQNMQYQQAMMNQSQVSQTTSTAPQHADSDYVQKYQMEIQSLFMSGEFKTADQKTKKEVVGNAIYKHVEKIVGEQKAPKITGMLIDLPEVELNYSISQWGNFEQKVVSAHSLITQNENRAPPATPDGPVGKQVQA